MGKFVPVEGEGDSPLEEQAGKETTSEIQKAKEAAEVKKYKAQEVESERQIAFAQSDIKDTAELKARLAVVTEKENKLAKDFMDFENKKATQFSELQKLKAEHERKVAEFVKREQDLVSRTTNVEIREKLVQEREDLMNSVEKQNLEETEKRNSLLERLKQAFPQIVGLLGDNANVLIRVGFRNFGYDLWDDIEQMQKWAKNDIGEHCESMVSWLKEEVEDCNKKAVLMARSPQQYSESVWNGVVDNLEEIYKLLPELKPDYLPADTEK